MITADRAQPNASAVSISPSFQAAPARLTRILAFSLPLVWGALAALLWQPHFHSSDLGHYYHSSENALRGMAPYRDFPFEYPPLALVPMIVPRLLGGGRPVQFQTYVWLFLLENTVLLALLQYYVVRIARLVNRRPDENRTIVSFAILAMIGAPILAWRMDLFVAVLTAAAVVAVFENRPDAAGAMIGIGFATKLYPVVLLPVLVARYAAEKNWRAALRLCAAAGIVSVLVFLPFVLRAPADILSFLRYHAMRGLEIESVAAGFLLLGHVLRGVPLSLVINYGALHLRSPAADAALRWLPALFPVAIVALSVVVFRRFRADEGADGDERALCDAVLASLLVFIVANKVFSPQYLAWLLPFAPFLSRRRAVVMVALFALTIAIFPFSFEQLVQLRPGAVLLLNARNVLAVALAGWVIVGLRKAVEAS
jgi:hypothetical protein